MREEEEERGGNAAGVGLTLVREEEEDFFVYTGAGSSHDFLRSLENSGFLVIIGMYRGGSGSVESERMERVFGWGAWVGCWYVFREEGRGRRAGARMSPVRKLTVGRGREM